MEIARLKWAMLIICHIISINAVPSPALKKIPKVYNALITSDQNLEPSRAYPVIQPVIHRTSIGYASPFYYSPIGPGFVGPQVIPAPGFVPNGPEQPTEQPAKKNPDVEEVDVKEKNIDDRKSAEKEIANDEENKNDGTNKDKDRVPLSFYPNYQSLYYNPYFYQYNPYPHVVPGTYYFDYQPRGPLVPVPPPPPPLSPPIIFSGQINPNTAQSVPNGSTPSKPSAQGEKKKRTSGPVV